MQILFTAYGGWVYPLDPPPIPLKYATGSAVQQVTSGSQVGLKFEFNNIIGISLAIKSPECSAQSSVIQSSLYSS